MIAEAQDNLSYLSELKLSRLEDLAVEAHVSETVARQSKGMILYTIWRYDKWKEATDSDGNPYQTIGQYFKDLGMRLQEASAGTAMSVSMCWKLVTDIKIQIGNGIDERDVTELPLRLVDEIKTLGTYDRETGKILDLSPEAKENLPLPEASPTERIRALLQELPHLSRPDQYARVRDIKGRPNVGPAQVQHDDLEQTISFSVVDLDSGETHGTVRASYETQEGLNYIARAYGVSDYE